MQAKAKSAMSPHVVSISASSPLCEATALMTEKRIRHLVVHNQQQEVVGVITKRDFGFIDSLGEIPVGYMMSSPAVRIDQNAPLRSAIFKILETKMSSLLVSNEQDQIVGIITTDDLLWYLAHILSQQNESHFSITSLVDLQTIGEAAKQMALAGL